MCHPFTGLPHLHGKKQWCEVDILTSFHLHMKMCKLTFQRQYIANDAISLLSMHYTAYFRAKRKETTEEKNIFHQESWNDAMQVKVRRNCFFLLQETACLFQFRWKTGIIAVETETYWNMHEYWRWCKSHNYQERVSDRLLRGKVVRFAVWLAKKGTIPWSKRAPWKWPDLFGSMWHVKRNTK